MHKITSFFFFLPSYPSIVNRNSPVFVEDKVSPTPTPTPAPAPSGPAIPRFAYFISGSKGDLEKLWRTLFALYHPINHYVVHLDLESPQEERLELASRIQKEPVFNEVGNVFLIAKANMVTYRGPTMIANTLHACAILLKRSNDWDWFINLSASDYPLVTQDDLLFAFSSLDRNLNFIEHTSKLGWKLEKRAKPLIVDPGLYMSTKSDVFWVNPKRTLPTAFKLFTGSAWTVLSRGFVEYVVWGWDNLPRILLMYYTNFVSSPEGYFQTLVCNVPELAKNTVNHDLHYISWDYPPKQHPHILNINDTDKMIASNAAFARKFNQDDPALDEIDKKLLHRKKGRFTPGGWCSGKPSCSKVGDLRNIKPGPGSQRLLTLIFKMSYRLFDNQCK
ncbi:beta-glucuronosyltransferase GlcAT14A-like [Senna tora]|uniref:Beta-glucuronosyltransferase GlcAT14A-like n=1 Tax=Senna tora TaxID=362788 RepID=A0A834X200_9FABA|nr:beta-glucuronosyltransferase GlcAT14A-like [Senna tora]